MKARILYANARNETQRVVRCTIPAKGAVRRLLRIAKFGGNVEISVRGAQGRQVMHLQTGAYPYDRDTITLADHRGIRQRGVVVRGSDTFRTLYDR